MGYSISFIGVQGVAKDTILDILGVKPSDRVVDPFGVPFAWAETTKGWLVMASDDPDFAAPPRLKLLSAGGKAVGCWVEEHVMATQAWWYRDGELGWSLAYEAETSERGIVVEGEPPPAFATLYEKARRKQAAEMDSVDHIHDVPPTLAGAICGFRYDGNHGGEFTELMLPVPPSTPGLFARLFGR